MSSCNSLISSLVISGLSSSFGIEVPKGLKAASVNPTHELSLPCFTSRHSGKEHLAGLNSVTWVSGGYLGDDKSGEMVEGWF